jgi:hypothetical protein
MTPQERELLTALFDRLATLENQPRDPDAERAIIEGLRRAPNATYALVQTALVQDEALRRANARIQELEARSDDPSASQPTGFLDSMRDALLGHREPPRGGSVPSVGPARPQAQDQSAAFASGAPASGAPWRQAPASGGGSSFLGTAASAAAGVIGGSLLLDGIRSMMGPSHGAFGMVDPAFGGGREAGSPWDTTGGGDLARQAGTDDIGRHQQGDGAGSFDSAAADDGTADPGQDAGASDDDASDFAGGDFGGDDSGGGDFGSSDA